MAVQQVAHLAVEHAIRDGELENLRNVLTKCADCNFPALVYDHRDYRRPLDVQPVCKSCDAKRWMADPYRTMILLHYDVFQDMPGYIATRIKKAKRLEKRG